MRNMRHCLLLCPVERYWTNVEELILKVKLLPVHNMKKCKGVEVWHHSFLNLVLEGSGQLHGLATLLLRNGSQYTLKKRLVGPVSEDILEMRKMLPLPEITPQFLCCPVHRLVTVSIKLSQLCTEMIFVYIISGILNLKVCRLHSSWLLI